LGGNEWDKGKPGEKGGEVILPQKFFQAQQNGKEKPVGGGGSPAVPGREISARRKREHGLERRTLQGKPSSKFLQKKKKTLH